MVEFAADLVVESPRIITMDAQLPAASAMAIKDGLIVAVGDQASVEPYVDEHTEVLRIDGTVVPGFIDAHCHPLQAGITALFELPLSPEADFPAVCAAVAEYASDKATDAWILGSGWGTGLIPELSTEAARKQLDQAAGGRPVLLVDDSHHNRWASSRALELAGITDSTPDPDRGRIVRDPETGRATGLLFEAAGVLVAEAASTAATHDAAEWEAATQRAVAMLHPFGITAVQDAAASRDSLRAYAALDQRGELDAWVVSCLTVNDQIFGYDAIGDELIAERDGVATAHHRPTFIKIFLDGVPPAFSGAFLRPYLDDGHHSHDFAGEPTMPFDELRDWLVKTARLGLSAKVHCTGDASARMVLDAVAEVRALGYTEPQYHVAHGQFIDPADLPRFAELGVVAEASPYLWFPGVIADVLRAVRPGEEIDRIQPNRSLLDAGALLAIGSDWPVSETPHVLLAVEALVTRADPTGRRPGQLGASEAITVDEALRAVTIDGARALGIDGVTGSLAAGKSADFLVLDQDLRAVPSDQIARTRVQETWVRGIRVFEND